jgi:hypothetical protein
MSASNSSDLENVEEFHARLKSMNRQWTLKIVHCLIFVKEHPSEMVTNIIGLRWINTKVFICNSLIFAKFLGMKANTLNLNFRDHGFIKTSNDREAYWKSRQNLYDVANWKPHEHVSGRITMNCTENDVNFVKYDLKINDVSEAKTATSEDGNDFNQSTEFPSDINENRLDCDWDLDCYLDLDYYLDWRLDCHLGLEWDARFPPDLDAWTEI